MDSKIFWFGFYGHLKMRKFRNFEDFRKLTIFKIFAKSATFFFRIFFAFQWILELVLRVAGKIEPFFGPKSVFFAKWISPMIKKIQKNLIFSIFFFQKAKKGSEKLKCNDIFFFSSILPPKKWGKTIENLLTFPKIKIPGLSTCVHL